MKTFSVASREYREVLKQTHATSGRKWGHHGASHLETIAAFRFELGADIVLDYGCGTGTLAKAAKDFLVREYDPGIEGKDHEPLPADLVVATDVLEHVEPDKVDAVLHHIRELSRKGTFLIIATKPAKQVLADGRNAHLSVHEPDWWLERLRVNRFNVRRTVVRKGLWVWATK